MKCLIIDGVVDKDMLFFIHSEEMPSMAVFYDLAIWNLYLF